MKLTTKCRYGSRAVVEIARKYGKGRVKRREIIENQNIPDSFLENILISLKNSGILNAVRGPHGGFILRRHPADLTMYDVVTVLEDSMLPVDCLDEEGDCEKIAHCVTRPVWKKLAQAQEEVLKSFTIQDLVESIPIQQELELV